MVANRQPLLGGNEATLTLFLSMVSHRFREQRVDDTESSASSLGHVTLSSRDLGWRVVVLRSWHPFEVDYFSIFETRKTNTSFGQKIK